MTDVILHQYDSSPFSEKVRVCLGIKRLAWRAVDQPVIMPKPELLTLTGGYRRIPVMQIGANVYCDSVLIVRELERRFPTPTLFPNGDAGVAQASAEWTDRAFFQAAVTVIFGGIGDRIDPAFAADRAAMSGRSFDARAMAAAARYMGTQLRAHAAMISDQLADGRAFLGGEAPGLVDAGTYYNLWFVQRSFPPGTANFADLPHLSDWMARVAGIGHGERGSMTRDEAIAVAQAATPMSGDVLPRDEALAGKPVTVSATDYARDPIAGVLVGSTEHSVSVRRDDPRAGTVVVHVPRLGYALAAA